MEIIKVKCKGCGKQIEKENAFLHIHTTKSGNKQNMYYCSEEEYSSITEEKEYYKKCQLIIDEIFGFPIVDNTRNKKLSELHNAGYKYKVIYNCIFDNKEKIERALILKREDFKGKNEMYLKLSYCFGIIKKEISNYSEQKINKLNQETISKDNFYNTKRKEKKEKRSLMDLIRGVNNG